MREYKTVGPNFKTYYYYTNEQALKDNVKATIVIAPGIEATGALYDEIGEYLDSKGYALYTLDEWGYGKTGKVGKNVNKNWKRVDFHFVAYNVHSLASVAKKQHPDAPLYLIGNDFGAMLSLYLIREFPDVVDKIVTIGWGSPRLQDYGFLFTSFIRKLCLFDDSASKLGHFGKNKSLAFRFERHSKYAWLSSDAEQVKKIVDAGYIDQPGTVGHYFFYYLNKVRVPYFMRMKKSNRKTPILFMSGSEDLLTLRGGTTKSLARYYKFKGFTNVESMIISGRHELLFEKNRFENMDIILDWLEDGVVEPIVVQSQVEKKETPEVRVLRAQKSEESPIEVIEVEQPTIQHNFQDAEEDLLIRTHKEQE